MTLSFLFLPTNYSRHSTQGTRRTRKACWPNSCIPACSFEQGVPHSVIDCRALEKTATQTHTEHNSSFGFRRNGDRPKSAADQTAPPPYARPWRHGEVNGAEIKYDALKGADEEPRTTWNQIVKFAVSLCSGGGAPQPWTTYSMSHISQTHTAFTTAQKSNTISHEKKLFHGCWSTVSTFGAPLP